MKIIRFAALCFSFASLAACTQDPAEVSYKGDSFFGRVHEEALDSPSHETFPENSPRLKPGYARPGHATPGQTVGVTDLAPPTANAPQGQQMASAGNGSPFGRPSPPLANAQSEQDQTQAQDSPAKKVKFIWPVNGGKIVSHFGPKSNGRSNDGINISVPEGEPIWAAAGGTAVYAGSDLKGYGNMVILRHGGGWMTAYAHARSIAIKKGDTVKQGDIIAYVGQTGSVTTPQVHFAIRDGRTPVDPELYLAKVTAGQ